MLTLRHAVPPLSTLHWIVVALSLILTFSAWQLSSRIAEEKARNQFDHQIEQLNELLRDRMQKYEFALMSGAGAIRASGQKVNLDLWRRFSDSLALDERLPGINGIGVIERVSPDHIDAYVAQKRQERPEFQVHPAHQNQDFWPIVYIEPEDVNKAAVGLDMAHEENRYQAAQKAMNTGQSQITGPIVLVQDAQRTPGFLFFRPFYDTAETPAPDQREARFEGLVYAPFIMSKLMEGTLAKASRLVHFKVTDGDTTLYSELGEQRGENYDASPMFSDAYTLPMYGRDWHFVVQTTRLFERFNQSRQPAVILMGGVVIDGLILLVFVLMANARRRAERKVMEKTSELRESLDFINTLTDNLPLSVSVWDEHLNCRFINVYGRRLFRAEGYNPIGQPLERFLGRELVARRRDFYRRALAGERVVANASFADPEGELRDVVVSYYPVTLAGESCFMATTMDITNIVQREKELQFLNEELEKQKQEAESAVTVKTAFLANMSHEIRTPMNAIIGVLVMLQEAGLEDYPKRLVGKAFSASEALLQLLNDILDLSKIEADRIELDFQPFDIDALVHRSVDLFAMVAEEKALALDVTVDPATPGRVVGDLLRISQICTNLVGNAIKFTRQGGVQVRITWEPTGTDAGTLTVAVSDTGIGIRSEDRDRIFDSFRQADESTSRNFGGTGLGLAISRRLAQLMGAELDVESVEGKGSTFWLSVPVGVAPADNMAEDAATALPEARASQFPGLSALVVDDVPLNCEIVESYLKAFGVEIQSVPGGRQAIEAVTHRHFDLVLMDLHLDGETGQEVAARIASLDLPRPPVMVALSASIADHDRLTAEQAGMKEYLTKPVIPEHIRGLLERRFQDHQVWERTGPDAAPPEADGHALPPFVNVEVYQQLFGHDESLFARCVRSFLASVDGMLAEARQAARPEAIRGIAHKIRGAAANIADTPLSALAGDVEEGGNQGDLPARLEALAEMLDEHRRWLALCVPEPEAEGVSGADSALLAVAVARVKQKLSGHRIADDYDLGIIFRQLAALGQDELSRSFRHALDVYDFDEALALLTEVPHGRPVEDVY